MERMIRDFNLGGEGWKGEKTEVVGGVSFTSRFDTDKITQIDWLRFVEEIMSNRYDFVFYAFCDLEPAKHLNAGLMCVCVCLVMWVMAEASAF